MTGLVARWKTWRNHRAMAHALQRRAISDALWQLTLQRYSFLAARNHADREDLRRLASLFLDQKEFTGIDGFVVTDEVAVAVAAQACLPVLRLGLQPYAGFVGLVMHAAEVVAKREVFDEQGLVHQYEEVIAGEAMEGGPIMLSWEDASGALGATAASADHESVQKRWGYNVVIHEFAHVLDLANGDADGMPTLVANANAAHWRTVMQTEFDHFQERVVCGHDTVIDPYGAQSIDEFFAVASESFFVTAAALRDDRPALYELLASYYQQNPAGDSSAFSG